MARPAVPSALWPPGRPSWSPRSASRMPVIPRSGATRDLPQPGEISSGFVRNPGAMSARLQAVPPGRCGGSPRRTRADDPARAHRASASDTRGWALPSAADASPTARTPAQSLQRQLVVQDDMSLRRARCWGWLPRSARQTPLVRRTTTQAGSRRCVGARPEISVITSGHGAPSNRTLSRSSRRSSRLAQAALARRSDRALRAHQET